MKKWLGLIMVVGFVLSLTGMAMADSTTVTVSANVVGTCKFNSGGTMPFGALNPASPTDVNATVTQPTFWCTKGASYTISDDNGLHVADNPATPNHRVKHASLDEYITYTFTYTASGTGNGPTNSITMDIGGTILGNDYKDASEGDYADTVTLTITP